MTDHDSKPGLTTTEQLLLLDARMDRLEKQVQIIMYIAIVILVAVLSIVFELDGLIRFIVLGLLGVAVGVAIGRRWFAGAPDPAARPKF